MCRPNKDRREKLQTVDELKDQLKKWKEHEKWLIYKACYDSQLFFTELLIKIEPYKTAFEFFMEKKQEELSGSQDKDDLKLIHLIKGIQAIAVSLK